MTSRVPRLIRGLFGNRTVSVRENPEGVYALLVANADDSIGGTVTDGHNTNVDTVASALGGDVPCVEVLIQAAHGNAGTVYVGGVGTEYFELAAGESVARLTTNVNLISVKASQNDQTVIWWAR